MDRTCVNCSQTFKSISLLKTHLNRKKPCIGVVLTEQLRQEIIQKDLELKAEKEADRISRKEMYRKMQDEVTQKLAIGIQEIKDRYGIKEASIKYTNDVEMNNILERSRKRKLITAKMIDAHYDKSKLAHLKKYPNNIPEFIWNPDEMFEIWPSEIIEQE